MLAHRELRATSWIHGWSPRCVYLRGLKTLGQVSSTLVKTRPALDETHLVLSGLLS